MEYRLRNIYIYHSNFNVYDKSPKSWPYIMWNNLWLNNTHIYFNNKTLFNLNRKAFKCIICINYIAASKNCLKLQKTLIYPRHKKTIYFIPFLIYFNTFVSLIGSHVTWMLFVLHAAYSRFCKDGLMMVNWTKQMPR